jgi:hypothetical protein
MCVSERGTCPLTEAFKYTELVLCGAVSVTRNMMPNCDDIEVVTFSATVGVPAAQLDGSTAFGGGDNHKFNGLQLVDYDSVVDRNEELRLVDGYHRMVPSINSTETADGSLRAAVAVLAEPSLPGVVDQAANQKGTDIGDSEVDGEATTSDSIDLIGRPLSGIATGPFSDSGTGVGGGGSSAGDEYRLASAPAEFGQFHPRDELFLAGRLEVDNVDDAGVHIQMTGQHMYEVVHDC